VIPLVALLGLLTGAAVTRAQPPTPPCPTLPSAPGSPDCSGPPGYGFDTEFWKAVRWLGECLYPIWDWFTFRSAPTPAECLCVPRAGFFPPSLPQYSLPRGYFQPGAVAHGSALAHLDPANRPGALPTTGPWAPAYPPVERPTTLPGYLRPPPSATKSAALAP